MIARAPLFHHLLVLAQLAAVAMAIIPSSERDQAGLHWLLVAAVGIALGVYTLIHNRLGNFSIYPQPLDHARLITSGPYRYSRHPMYLALVVMMVGIAGYNGGVRAWLGVALVSAVVTAKALLEERLLVERFPEYPAYAARTGRILPFL